MTRLRVLAVFAACVAAYPCLGQGAGSDSGLTVDKEKGLVKIDAKVAPRKVLKDNIYPIEVIACWPHPKGKKAHETVVTIEVKPSAVHKALVGLGLKAGKPVMGESKAPPQGSEVDLYLEVTGPDGAVKRLTMDRVLVDKRNGKPFPKSIRFRFTGSAMVQPDPEKDDTVYGADLSGTLIAIFPVTDQTVFQSNKTIADEKFLKLETNPQVLPKEGTSVKLVIAVPRGK
ncbi:MAG: hypothetical protein IT429_04825 [Gemmataceae bacterium]|nr:hypothetical protein [Gemmataceae bacterium]